MTRILDLLCAVWFFGLVGLAVFAAPDRFAELTKVHPLAMGFLKFALLATFGEHLKRRMLSGAHNFESARVFLMRTLGWGLFGLWVTTAFPIFSAGVNALVRDGLWPAGPALWLAFSKSLWINLLGGYGFVMMLSHEWLNTCIRDRRPVALPAFAATLDRAVWFGTVPKTILLFWIPAHTVTFSLPGEWRILAAAMLSVALGFLIAAGAGRVSRA